MNKAEDTRPPKIKTPRFLLQDIIFVHFLPRARSPNPLPAVLPLQELTSISLGPPPPGLLCPSPVLRRPGGLRAPPHPLPCLLRLAFASGTSSMRRGRPLAAAAVAALLCSHPLPLRYPKKTTDCCVQREKEEGALIEEEEEEPAWRPYWPCSLPPLLRAQRRKPLQRGAAPGAPGTAGSRAQA